MLRFASVAARCTGVIDANDKTSQLGEEGNWGKGGVEIRAANAPIAQSGASSPSQTV